MSKGYPSLLQQVFHTVVKPCLVENERKGNLSLILNTAYKGRILDAATCITQSGDRSVVGPSSELLLHSLGEHGSVDIGVSRSFLCELNVKVCVIKGIGLTYGQHTSYNHHQ